MEQLSVLYTQELDSLSVGDMGKFSALQGEKLRLIKDCENGVAEIAARHDAVKLCNPSLRDRVLEAHAALTDLAKHSQSVCNSRARSMKRIQERLLDAARNIVNKNRKSYGRRGQSQTGGSHNRPVATAINEAI